MLWGHSISLPFLLLLENEGEGTTTTTRTDISPQQVKGTSCVPGRPSSAAAAAALGFDPRTTSSSTFMSQHRAALQRLGQNGLRLHVLLPPSRQEWWSMITRCSRHHHPVAARNFIHHPTFVWRHTATYQHTVSSVEPCILPSHRSFHCWRETLILIKIVMQGQQRDGEFHLRHLLDGHNSINKSCNRIGSEGSVRLRTSPLYSTRLQELSLSNCRIGNANLETLLLPEGGNMTHTLTEIHLGDNDIKGT
jgi:hypothetical protein